MQTLASLALLLLSGTAFAHPGHSSLAMHWHMEDLAWIVLGVLAVLGIGYLFVKGSKP